jgi:hypothetical protein
MLFHGPPGVGKTMLAERVPGLLPDLDLHDSLEVSAVHSLGSTSPTSSSPDRPTATPTIPHQLPASSAAVSESPGPVPFPAPTKDGARVHTCSPRSGDPVFTFYDRISRKPAASLTTEWGDDGVVAVPPDPVR